MAQGIRGELVRQVLVSLIVAVVLLVSGAVLGVAIHDKFATAALLITLSLVIGVVLRKTAPTRRRRAMLATFVVEPSASRAGDSALALLHSHLLAAVEIDLAYVSDLASRRRHPLSHFLDGLEVILERHRDDPIHTKRSAALQYIAAVRGAKEVARGGAASRAANHLRGTISDRSVLLLYGYSSIAVSAVIGIDPRVPVFVVKDSQYGVGDSVEEHDKVLEVLAAADVTASVIESDQLSVLLDPSATRVSLVDGRTLPLQSAREVIAVIGCEAGDARGRVLIPAKDRFQSSETAWFVQRFAAARKQGQGESISAILMIVGEASKLYDDMSGRPELRVTSAPVRLPRWRRAIFTAVGVGLPRGRSVELVEIGPEEIDIYVDDQVIAATRNGQLRLEQSVAAWSERVGTTRKALTGDRHDAVSLLRGCDLAVVDFNGVIVDDEVDHYCAFAAVTRETTGRSLPIDVYLEACKGLTDEEGIENLIESAFAHGPGAKLLDMKRQAYRDHAIPIQPRDLERIQTMLREVAQARPVVLLTSSDRESVATALGGETVLLALFDPEHAHYEVPSRARVETVTQIARSFGIQENRRCLVIDDSERNLADLRRKGFRTVGIGGLISNRALSADVVVRDLAELLDILTASKQ